MQTPPPSQPSSAPEVGDPALRPAPLHARLANPAASREERRAVQQARVGILRNPAEPKLPVAPPRDVWRKWPRLRSARRLQAGKDGGPGQQALETATAAQGAVPSPVAITDRVLDGSALDGFARVLRQARQG